MPDDATPHGEIDWTSASVDDATLTVELTGEPGADWRSRLQEILERLDRPGSGWGEIEVSEAELRVASLTAGCETDLRHLLDSALLQVNAEFEPDEDRNDDDDRSTADREMTEAFRSFASES